MKRSLPHFNQWLTHLTAKRSVTEMYDQLVRKGVIQMDSRQRAMAEACAPLLSAAREEARRREGGMGRRVRSLLPLRQGEGSVAGAHRHSESAAWWRRRNLFPSVLTRVSASLVRRRSPGCGLRAVPVDDYPEVIAATAAAKRGLYLHGEVGIGKTMILDLFELCDVGLPKRRTHLHSFMTEISDRLVMKERQLCQCRQAARGHPRRMRALSGVRPIDLVVCEVLSETPVLCFDECQTFDVAHAALLSAFFTAAFEKGLFLFTTSNRPPEELCTVSAAFAQFLPCLRDHCAIVGVGPIRDYRQRPASEHCHRKVFLHPSNQETAHRLLRRVEAGIQARTPSLEGAEGGVTDPPSVVARGSPTWVTGETLWHHGRCLVVPYSCGGVAVFDFTHLCSCCQRCGLASADFQLLARRYHTVVVYDVPPIGTANRNVAHQFIVLVDELYQHNVKLLFTSQVPWEQLLDTTRHGVGHATIESGEETAHSDYYSEGEDERSGYRAAYSFRNEEELIAFTRVRSRLAEMGCSSYLTKDHACYLTADFDFSALIADDDDTRAEGAWGASAEGVSE